MSLTKVTYSMISGEAANVFDFGVKGDGITDDTAAIQVAINYCVANTNSGTSTSPAKGPITLIFPPGYYKISSPLNISGPISIVGQSNAEYSSGVRIFQTTSNDLFFVKPSVTNPTFSIKNVTLLSTIAGTGHLINFQPTGTTYFNSNRIINCCFSNPQQMALRLCGDDVKIDGCTFDVSGYSGNCIQLGSNATGDKLTNSLIINCDFFNIIVHCILAYNCQGIVVANNKISQPNSSTTTLAFFDALDSTPVFVDGVAITGNNLYGCRRLFAGNSVSNILFNSNVCFNSGIGALEDLDAITMQGISKNICISGNVIEGTYGNKSVFNNQNGTNTVNSLVLGNVFTNTGGAGPAILSGNMTGFIGNSNVFNNYSVKVSSNDYFALGYAPLGRIDLVYSATIATNASLGSVFTITVTDGSAFTISTPSNSSNGQTIAYTIRNTSGISMGVITWNASFHKNAFVNPDNGYNQTISFQYNTSLGYWTEVSRTATQVPN
jgi:hypothetical protein